eukprot:3824610-Prymnesium_polylepis.1
MAARARGVWAARPLAKGDSDCPLSRSRAAWCGVVVGWHLEAFGGGPRALRLKPDTHPLPSYQQRLHLCNNLRTARIPRPASP